MITCTDGRDYEVDDQGVADEVIPYEEEFIPDEDGSEAFARMLERRAEAGSWFGR